MNTVTYDGVTVVKETVQALLVRLENGNEHWIPKKCIHDDSEVFAEDTEGELVVFEWFAEKEGIE